MNNLPHILILASWYPTESNPLNGNFIKKIAVASSLNYKVTLIHIANTSTKNQEKIIVNDVNPNFQERICYTSKSKLNPLKFLKIGNSQLKEIEKQRGKINFCHVQVVWKMGIVAYYFKKRYKIPYTITEHWTGYLPQDYQLGKKFIKPITAIVAKNANGFIAVSENLAKTIFKLKLTPQKPKVLHNIVDFYDIEKQKNNCTKFISISNLRDEQKNISGIIKAFTEAFHHNPNIELTLIGGNNFDDYLKFFNERNIPSNIKIVFSSPHHKEILNQIANADCLISFSNFETFAITCAEALCCGIPVIYTACGGPEEYIAPEMGIEVEIGNTSALTKAILDVSSAKVKFNHNQIKEIARKNFNQELWLTNLRGIYKEMGLLP